LDTSLALGGKKKSSNTTNNNSVVYGVIGVSLGGHVTLMSATHDERIRVACSLIGCGDYRKLMQDRAVSNKSSFDDYYPAALQTVVDKYDPVNNVPKLAKKAILLINGGADTVSFPNFFLLFCLKLFVPKTPPATAGACSL
jgi:S-formylglutathione hydrolase FrmB